MNVPSLPKDKKRAWHQFSIRKLLFFVFLFAMLAYGFRFFSDQAKKMALQDECSSFLFEIKFQEILLSSEQPTVHLKIYGDMTWTSTIREEMERISLCDLSELDISPSELVFKVESHLTQQIEDAGGRILKKHRKEKLYRQFVKNRIAIDYLHDEEEFHKLPFQYPPSVGKNSALLSIEFYLFGHVGSIWLKATQLEYGGDGIPVLHFYGHIVIPKY